MYFDIGLGYSSKATVSSRHVHVPIMDKQDNRTILGHTLTNNVKAVELIHVDELTVQSWLTGLKGFRHVTA